MDENGFGWRLLIAALATWRLAHLLVVEDGPFNLAARLRVWLGPAGRTLDCLHCTSLWLAAPLALFVSTDPAIWWAVWLALSGAAGLAHRATESAPAIQTFEGEHNGMLWTEPRQPDAEPAADDQFAGTDASRHVTHALSDTATGTGTKRSAEPIER